MGWSLLCPFPARLSNIPLPRQCWRLNAPSNGPSGNTSSAVSCDYNHISAKLPEQSTKSSCSHSHVLAHFWALSASTATLPHYAYPWNLLTKSTAHHHRPPCNTKSIKKQCEQPMPKCAGPSEDWRKLSAYQCRVGLAGCVEAKGHRQVRWAPLSTQVNNKK